MGYKLAGFDVVAANDIDPKMAKHYRKNLNPKHYFLCPIKELLKRELPEELFGLDVLDGSPPCSTFSMAGLREKDWGKNKHFKEGQAKQVLSDLFFDYLSLVERLRPRVAVAENVKGILLGNAKGYTKAVAERFRQLGYRPQVFLINAADCGVPQKRERAFFCAVREDVSQKRLSLNPSKKWITTTEATSDLKTTPEEARGCKLSPSIARYWPKVKKGKSFSTVHPKGSFFNIIRLSDRSPSCTLTTKTSGFTHWNEPRFLTLMEYKRLGSFPDDYKAENQRVGKYLIGMSVPPRMMEFVASQIRDQWLLNV